MPGMNGFEVCRALKQGPATSGAPILFISNLDSSQDTITAFQVGGVDFIRKPFHRDEVLARVKVHLQLMDASHQLQDLNRDLESRVEERTAELLTALRLAESASRVKSNFQASVSHELRTPLNAILGFSDALSTGVFGSLTTLQLGYVQDIYNSGRHMLAIVDDLLDITVAEVGHLQLAEETINLSTVIAQAVQMLEPRVEKVAISLSASFDVEDICIFGDYSRILQVLLNVLGNAIKFNRVGGWVRINVKRENGGGCSVDISDSGIGMTPEEVVLALTPFGRSGNASIAAMEGNGLGLPLAVAIVAAHGGKLTVNALKNVGTVIRITLPEERVAGGVG